MLSKKQFKAKSSKQITGLDETYSGPINIPIGPQKVTSLIVNRTLPNLIVTNGAGILVNNYKTSDVTGVSDWSNLQQVWAEYRILAMELTFIPIAQSSSDPICVVVVGDHDPNVNALTSMVDGASYENAKYFACGAYTNNTTQKYFKYAMRASGVDELGFTDMATAQGTKVYGIKTYSTGGTATARYVEVLQKFTIEFRGSK